MARMTRSQRRARRQAQAASAAGQSGGGSGATARVAQVRPQQLPPKTQTGARRKEEKGGARTFIAECWGELKKVEWPTQSHLIQGTAVVLVACIIVGFYIWVCDILSKNIVQDIFLR